MKRIVTAVLVLLAFAPLAPGQGEEEKGHGARPPRRAATDLDIIDLSAGARSKTSAHDATEVAGRRGPPARTPEEVAERFVARFAATLDFGVAYRELVVSHPGRRGRILSGHMPLGLSLHSGQGVDPSLLEESYIAGHHLQSLRSLYLLSAHRLSDLRRNGDAAYPPALEAAVRAAAADFEKKTVPLTTAEKVRRMTGALNSIARVYREHMPAKPLETPTYKANLDEIYRAFGITPGRAGTLRLHPLAVHRTDGKVHTLVRGIFLFEIKQEEDGDFRVYYAHPVVLSHYLNPRLMGGSPHGRVR